MDRALSSVTERHLQNIFIYEYFSKIYSEAKIFSHINISVITYANNQTTISFYNLPRIQRYGRQIWRYNKFQFIEYLREYFTEGFGIHMSYMSILCF